MICKCKTKTCNAVMKFLFNFTYKKLKNIKLPRILMPRILIAQNSKCPEFYLNKVNLIK